MLSPGHRGVSGRSSRKRRSRHSSSRSAPRCGLDHRSGTWKRRLSVCLAPRGTPSGRAGQTCYRRLKGSFIDDWQLFPPCRQRHWASRRRTTSAKPSATNCCSARTATRLGPDRRIRALDNLNVFSRQMAWADNDIEFDVYVEGMRRGAANTPCRRLMIQFFLDRPLHQDP